MAHPTDEKSKQMISGKSLDNCSIVVNDVTNSHSIFGPSRPGLRGETVRQRPERVVQEYLEITKDFYQMHHFVTLTADVMFVNGISFLLLCHGTSYLVRMNMFDLARPNSWLNFLMKIVKLYPVGGFVVRNVHMDVEFEKI